MSFKCPHYVYRDGNFVCELLYMRHPDRRNYLSVRDLERWCWNENGYLNCPYR